LKKMNRQSKFSYLCNQCGRCCRDKVITLSPYDVLRLARAAGISTGEAVTRYTIRRGSILKFKPEGGCAALDETCCAVHSGRPLACRLYPLGLERTGNEEHFVQLEPARGSLGVCGADGTVEAFLTAQDVAPYLQTNEHYRRLLPLLRARIAALVDFDATEPREFWRCAVREALAESNFDPNPLIGALFDPNELGCGRESDTATVEAHIEALEDLVRRETHADILATAAVLPAVKPRLLPRRRNGSALSVGHRCPTVCKWHRL
jgi:Fe-S-cluster containining protein